MAVRRDYIGGPGNGAPIEEGANWVDSFRKGTMTNPNNPVATDFTPADLTGYTATFKVREVQGNGPSGGGRLVLDASSFVSIDGPNGTVSWNVPAASTVGLDFTSGVYALELTSGAGVVTRELEGRVRYTPRVNR